MDNYEVDDIVEPFGDDEDIIRLTPLEELSQELLSESIKYQIMNPFSSSNNLLQEFIDEYDETRAWLDGNDDAMYENNNIAIDFYRRVLNMLDKRFNLGLDYTVLESLNVDGLCNLTEGLYTFFVMKYEKNISKYLTRTILDYKDTIIDTIAQDKAIDTDSVSYISYKRKLRDAKDVFIFTEINNVIKTIASLDLSPEDFIEIYNEEKFEVAVVKYAIENFIITGDFVKAFLNPIMGYEVQNDEYDRIISDVLQNLYKKLKLDKIPGIDQLENMSEKSD